MAPQRASSPAGTAREADAPGRVEMQEPAVQHSDAPENGSSVDPERSKVEQLLRDAEIETVLGELDEELVALKPVKTRIREIAALLLVDKLRRELELSS